MSREKFQELSAKLLKQYKRGLMTEEEATIELLRLFVRFAAEHVEEHV